MPSGATNRRHGSRRGYNPDAIRNWRQPYVDNRRVWSLQNGCFGCKRQRFTSAVDDQRIDTVATVDLQNALRTSNIGKVLNVVFVNKDAIITTTAVQDICPAVAGEDVVTVAANDLIELQGIASGSGVLNGDETDYNNPNVYSIVKLWKVS